ncbi:MAG TPA: Gfo/Idh/MocA family oxidoreductase [Verrucomicrobiales bacterium]|nr:Gfo/Idh/MocA family oxidoreductase [Verrucomicrobiales bacterium]HIL71663.1 Gfo/Idh/MocA family oxidoreductase [Verrucomicrobiota bacterium]
MTPPPIRLALVGCSHDTTFWSEVALRLQNACFTVLIDADSHLAPSIAKAIGASIVVKSLETALENHPTEFDAVVVNLPHSASRRKVEAIIEANRQSKHCFTIGRSLRFHSASQTILDCLSCGKLGNPSLLRVHRWQGIHTGKRPLLEDILFADVDFALLLFAAKPTDVYAVGHGTNATPDYFQIHFGFPAGGMAVLDFSTALPVGRGYESLSLIASKGAVYADDHHNTHLLFRGGDPTAMISAQGNYPIAFEIQTHVNAIVEQAQTPVDVEDYRNAQLVIDAIERSLESGKVLHQVGGTYV